MSILFLETKLVSVPSPGTGFGKRGIANRRVETSARPRGAARPITAKQKMDHRGTVTPPPRTPPPPDAGLDSGESTPRRRRGSFYMAPRLAASAPPVPLSPGLSSVQARHPKALEGHEELLPEALAHASGRLQGLGSADSGSRYDVAPNPPTMAAPVAISAVSLSLVKPEDYRERVQLTQTQIDLDPLESHLAHRTRTRTRTLTLTLTLTPHPSP